MIDPSTYSASYYNAVGDRMAGYTPKITAKSQPDAPSASAAPATPDPAKPAQTGFLEVLKDIFDVINPLQHIPIVGAIYRHLTGDIPNDVARIAGDALYGGPIGAAMGIADVTLKESTGKDMGETAMAFFQGAPKSTDTAVASNNSDIIWKPNPSSNNTAQNVQPNVAQNAQLPNNDDIIWNTPDPGVWNTPDPNAQSVPRAQVAARMMEALDKYQAMKKAEFQQPTVSQVF